MTTCSAHFEGREKKLLVILNSPQKGVRSNAGGCWEKVVRSCRADIVSRISNEMVDAYLLSESSLFVWEDRVLMITCGQTMLVNALPVIVDIVGRQNIAMVTYERKNHMFPDRQPTDFETDMTQMERYFQGKHCQLGQGGHNRVQLYCATPGRIPPGIDGTLQVLMHELRPSAMELFSNKNAGSAVQAAVLRRLTGLYEGMKADSHFFSPFGYSLNGICDDLYYTVHVTPQREGSYASFETNVWERDSREVVGEMASIFKPGMLSIVMTAGRMLDSQSVCNLSAAAGSGYRLVEKNDCRFECGYAATLVNFQRKGLGKNR
jgi:S-adenosylmethionine decarboxylase